MTNLAFGISTAVTLRFSHTLPLIQNRPFRFAHRSRPSRASTWRAANVPEPEQPESSASEDEVLSSSLQAKVKELFGSRQNVLIDVDTDSGVQFTVRRGNAELQETKAAWTVVVSIGVISIAAGAIFTVMYYAGAIHGSQDTARRYEMPTYGSKSYINPYELLEQDRQLQTSKPQ